MSSTVRIICIALLLSMQKICAISNNNYGGGPSSGINPPTLSSSGGDSSNQAKLTQDRLQKEQLYEAYNLLHTLAQDFHKPFDAPAVLVIGHQTSGKSALIEALMGFQFNQVGGGTKTRRPVALKMQYNPACSSPLCFLTLENGREEPRSLADIQAYIESENKRLERDPTRCFDPREINIRMEYKYCPNMIVIDTPGMLHAPRGRQLTPQQRALVQASKEAEALVLSKLKVQDYIILCVEDTTDWKHATTRNIVMQADPDLSRTVLVTTKLDTKLPQFSEKEDLEDFLSAPLIKRLYPRILGGPFFTSVPCGRVGVSKDFTSNEAFVRALLQAEKSDRTQVTGRVGAISAPSAMANVGVTRLRTFLESRVEDCYRRNVAKIVPMLQSELRHAEAKLEAVEVELTALSLDRLKQGANVYRERFSKELADIIHGSVKVSPEDWGETLSSEQLAGGSFLESEQLQSETWQRLIDFEVGNGRHKLFGGAQYHRAIREFAVAVRHMSTSTVSENEIANAAGMGDVHDGVNFMRAACVIAVEKAQSSFEPMLEALRYRTVHIMRRLFPIVEEMMRKSGSPLPAETHTRPFQEMIRKIYEKFVRLQIDECLSKCRDDLKGMTRFVTWDVDGKGGSSALYRSLPTPKKMVEIYSVAVENGDQTSKPQQPSPPQLKNSKQQDKEEQYRLWKLKKDSGNKKNNKKDDQKKGGNNKGDKGGNKSAADKVLDEWASLVDDEDEEDNMALTPVNVSPSSSGAMATSGGWKADEQASQVTDYYDLLQLTEEMLAGRNANRTSTVVTALVQFIIRSWRDHFARTVAMKFNCFFLMPFLDDFPSFLRNELDEMYESGVSEMFDITEARIALQDRRRDLIAECEANSKLQRRFDLINSQLRTASKEKKESNQQQQQPQQQQTSSVSSWATDELEQNLSPEEILRAGDMDFGSSSTGKNDGRRRYPAVEHFDMENL